MDKNKIILISLGILILIGGLYFYSLYKMEKRVQKRAILLSVHRVPR